MTASDALAAGNAAFEAKRWADAFRELKAADQEAPLAAAELERLATAAYLLWDAAGWADGWSRAYEQHVRNDDGPGAVRCAFWLAFGFMNSGEMAQGGGWLGRAQRLVEDRQIESAEAGYLLLPQAIEGVDADPAASLATFERAAEIGARFGDADLLAIARHGQGRALIRMGEASRGMALLDEVLLTLSAGQLSPIVTGDTYCGAIEACQEVFDVRRAREWTAVLSRWCDDQPDLVAYRGQCLVYRSGVFQIGGLWGDAMDDARAACARLSEPVLLPSAGAAFYQQGEMLRLRGELAAAEDVYRRADACGCDPQPGLALLRLAQGEAQAAAAIIRRVVQGAPDHLSLTKNLPAAVEILLAAGEVSEARAACDRFAVMAAAGGSAYLDALSVQAEGAVLLAEGDAAQALARLRRALTSWLKLDVPYAAARTRVLLGACCLKLGDVEGARLESEQAATAFERLGAAADLAALQGAPGASADAASGLTSRELDVLLLLAQGKTNRAIGDELVISEKTVARHVSNIFTKLDVSTRSAATAFAYEHGFVQRPT